MNGNFGPEVIFWASIIAEAAERIDYGEAIPELTEAFVSIWARHYAQIASMMRPRAKLLEIGTGYGVLAAGLGTMTGGGIFGTEHPSRGYLFNPSYKRFFNKYGVQIIANDLNEGLPFVDRSISQIYCCDVIEHLFVPDALYLLTEISRILKMGGELVFSTPNINRLSNLFRFCQGYSINPPQQISSYGRTHGHVHEYAPKEISALLTDVNLRPIRMKFGLNPLYTVSAFEKDNHVSLTAAKRINRLTALISRFFPGTGDQIYILARKN